MFYYKYTTKLTEDYKAGEVVDVFIDHFRVGAVVAKHKTRDQIEEEKKQARIATLKAELKELES